MTSSKDKDNHAFAELYNIHAIVYTGIIKDIPVTTISSTIVSFIYVLEIYCCY